MHHNGSILHPIKPLPSHFFGINYKSTLILYSPLTLKTLVWGYYGANLITTIFKVIPYFTTFGIDFILSGS